MFFENLEDSLSGVPPSIAEHSSAQTVDKTALCLTWWGENHKNTFLKSFLRILKVLFLEKAP